MTFVRRMKHWKERAAGWAEWCIDGACASCGLPARVRLVGTRADVAARSTEPLYCAACERAAEQVAGT